MPEIDNLDVFESSYTGQEIDKAVKTVIDVEQDPSNIALLTDDGAGGSEWKKLKAGSGVQITLEGKWVKFSFDGSAQEKLAIFKGTRIGNVFTLVGEKTVQDIDIAISQRKEVVLIDMTENIKKYFTLVSGSVGKQKTFAGIVGDNVCEVIFYPGQENGTVLDDVISIDGLKITSGDIAAGLVLATDGSGGTYWKNVSGEGSSVVIYETLQTTTKVAKAIQVDDNVYNIEGEKVNDGELTIVVNNIEVGKFTANQSEDTEIEINTVTQYDQLESRPHLSYQRTATLYGGVTEGYLDLSEFDWR